MTSQITTANIDVTYPKAGQDNDSQGFRDNFTYIVGAFETAITEIEALQSRAVLAGDLITNEVVVNDIAGSSITNGTFNKFYGSVYGSSTAVVTGQLNIDLNNGPFQHVNMGTNINFTFAGWPDAGQYGVIRLLMTSNLVGTPRTAAFYTEAGGNIVEGVNGNNPNGWSTTGGGDPHPLCVVPAQVTRKLTAAVLITGTVLEFNNIQGIQKGLSVTYVATNGDTQTATVTAVNVDTNQVTISVGAPTGGISIDTPVTFGYAGAVVVEAYTYDGGANVFLNQVAAY